MFQPHIERMAGYVPGEQPREPGFLKLNTNESPYPPSPKVLEAIVRAANDRLRLYPDPLATGFREATARLHGVHPDQVLVGNGSDDLLTILIRAFVGPRDVVAYPSPTYILYRTLAELQDARPVEVPFESDWTLDPDAVVQVRPKIVFLATPNSPSGTIVAPERVAELADRLSCPVVVDEAYVDFAETHCVGLVADRPNVIVTRTLSKGYGLAGLRVGYLLARPEVVRELIKVKDSYNCDSLSLAGGTAALLDQPYYREVWGRVKATRTRLTAALRDFGCSVPESRANFVWATGGPATGQTYASLKERKVLVRLMRYPGWVEGLRVTVGTDAEIDRFLGMLSET